MMNMPLPYFYLDTIFPYMVEVISIKVLKISVRRFPVYFPFFAFQRKHIHLLSNYTNIYNTIITYFYSM